MSIEEENELKQFLKVARPDWSKPRGKGQHSDLQRACDKLKAIGVHDVDELLRKVTENTLNEDLTKANKARFSRETIQSFRKEGAFWQSLNHSSAASYRQIGVFAPVPQLLAGRNLKNEALKARGATVGSLHPMTSSIHNDGSTRLRSAGSSRTAVSSEATAPLKRSAKKKNTQASLRFYEGLRMAYEVETQRSTSSPPRPNTVDTSSLISFEDSATLCSESPRNRPRSAALSISKSSDGGGDLVPKWLRNRGSSIDGNESEADLDVVPEFLELRPPLRGARARPKGGSTTNWRRRPLYQSTSCPQIPVLDCGSFDASTPLTPPSHGNLIFSSFGRERTASCMDRTPASASNASLAQDDEFDMDKARRWNRAGKAMTSKPLTPGWSSMQHNSMLQHGEAMLQEQEAMQQRRALFQNIALEGGLTRASPLRQHVASKIQRRLDEEKIRDAQAVTEATNACATIRNHIAGMSNARKCLSSLRLDVVQMQLKQPSTCPLTGLSLDFFHKSKQHTEPEQGVDGVGGE